MTTTRQLHLRQLQSIGERYVIGRVTHDEALAGIREITDDRDVLAEAVVRSRAAQTPSLRPEDWSAELLFVAAGADLWAVERYLHPDDQLA